MLVQITDFNSLMLFVIVTFGFVIIKLPIVYYFFNGKKLRIIDQELSMPDVSTNKDRYFSLLLDRYKKMWLYLITRFVILIISLRVIRYMFKGKQIILLFGLNVHWLIMFIILSIFLSYIVKSSGIIR